MIERIAKDHGLMRRLAEAAEGSGPLLTPSERARASDLRDGVARGLLVDSRRRATDIAARAEPPDLPAHRDWSWRPSLWCEPLQNSVWHADAERTELSPGLCLFHDCPLGEVSVRQIRAGEPPFALGIEIYAFRGSYLSLAIDLPAHGIAGLRRRHVLRIDCAIETERPMALYARLNAARGTTTTGMVREIPSDAYSAASIDFDLAGLKVDLSRAERTWIDLIFDAPRANALLLKDLFLSRTPRAEV